MKEIYIMNNGFNRYSEDDKPIALEKVKLLVNGATLKFEWASWAGPQNDRHGFKVEIENVKGPFGILEEFPVQEDGVQTPKEPNQK